MDLDQNTAQYFTNLVIDNFEGGYYHPNLKQYLKGGENMLDSGETMYGIDFVHGGSLGQSQFANEVHNFFAPYVAQVQDNSSAVKIYNDKANGKKVAPKEYGERWRPMVAAMMLDLFKQYFSYLNAGAQQMVLNDPALMLQFWYAVWNGRARFQKFAEIMNAAYNNGERNPQTINILILNERYKLPYNSTAKMDDLTAQMYGRPNYETATTKKRRLWPFLLLGGALIFMYLKNKE